MISIIISIIPFFLIGYHIFLVKRYGREVYNKLSMKKSGGICYECSEDLSNSGQNLISGSPTLCTSCDRDRSIHEILKHRKYIPLNRSIMYWSFVNKYKVKEFFFHKNFEKYANYIIIGSISCVFIQIILVFFKYDFSSIPCNLLLILYWSSQIIRIRFILNKKTLSI
jgi:hypothetical protein